MFVKRATVLNKEFLLRLFLKITGGLNVTHLPEFHQDTKYMYYEELRIRYMENYLKNMSHTFLQKRGFYFWSISSGLQIRVCTQESIFLFICCGYSKEPSQ